MKDKLKKILACVALVLGFGVGLATTNPVPIVSAYANCSSGTAVASPYDYILSTCPTINGVLGLNNWRVSEPYTPGESQYAYGKCKTAGGTVEPTNRAGANTYYTTTSSVVYCDATYPRAYDSHYLILNWNPTAGTYSYTAWGWTPYGYTGGKASASSLNGGQWVRAVVKCGVNVRFGPKVYTTNTDSIYYCSLPQDGVQYSTWARVEEGYN